jgi:hypothetical protein
MLAAFPPPGQPSGDARRSRGSWFRTTSWPRAPGRNENLTPTQTKQPGDNNQSPDDAPKKRRRCCGMPLWGLILLIIFIVAVVAVAIVLPLQFFVFKTLGNQEEPLSSIEQCRLDLDCQNGGTNVFTNGNCSCICTNGFTGSDCSVAGSDSCTTTNIVSGDDESSVQNVTVGTALPRLIRDASGNFTIPLSGTAILASLNSAAFSCREQNSLVTFDGRATRIGEADDEVIVSSEDAATETIERRRQRWQAGTNPTPRQTSSTESNDDEVFTVTEEVLDFCRVAMLYVLQEQNSREAESAQTTLQRFLSSIDRGESGEDAPIDSAKNVTIGGFSTVNLVDYQIDLGEGLVGGKPE